MLVRLAAEETDQQQACLAMAVGASPADAGVVVVIGGFAVTASPRQQLGLLAVWQTPWPLSRWCCCSG